VHAHVTVLSSTAVSGALGMYGDVVEGTEVTTDTANLLHEDLVVEARFELSLAGRGGGDVHGGLSSSKDNVVFDGGDGGAVEGRVGDVGLQNVELLNVDELGTVSIGGEDCIRLRLRTLAVLSLDAVMKYVRSGAHWMSVTACC
jgi:hypothetical protein